MLAGYSCLRIFLFYLSLQVFAIVGRELFYPIVGRELFYLIVSRELFYCFIQSEDLALGAAVLHLQLNFLKLPCCIHGCLSYISAVVQ